MSKGDLLGLIKNEVNGRIYHTSISSQLRLGGRSYPRAGEYLLEVDEYPLDEVYLIIITAANEGLGKVSWRVGIEELSITREFKPQVVVECGGYLYAVHLFDLSKVVKGGKTYTLTISCDSPHPITIDGVELVGVKRDSGLITEVDYRGGCILINQTENYAVQYSSKYDGRVSTSILLNMPSKNAKVDIVLNERVVKTLNNYIGLINTVINSFESLGNSTLSIYHRDSGAKYHPPFIPIYSILRYKMNKEGPKISIVVSDVRRKGNNISITATLRNEGDLVCDTLTLIALSGGNLFIRDVIRSLKPGEELSKSYDVDAKKANKLMVLRAIYKGLHGQEVSEVKTQLPS